jgi:hypothetical protein
LNFAALQFVIIIDEHKEASQTGCARESTDLCLREKGNDLQAGKARSLQDTQGEETLKGNGRPLREADEIVTMGWEEQRRIAQSKRVAIGGNVHDLLKAAFELAKTLGWTREQFMSAARDVAKAEKIPKTDETKRG